MLAHELRRRLAAIRVVGEVIATVPAGGDRLDRMLGLLTGELDDLDRLARDLLDDAAPARAGTVDAVAAVAAAARTVAAARGAGVEVRVPPGPVRVRAGATMLRQAVENLLDNAARYAAAGAVEVEVRADHVAGRVDVVVADRGPGPGASTGAHGHGLGLFLVRRFLDEVGGAAWVAERPGGGTLVGMRLPAAAAAGDGVLDEAATG